MVPLYKLVIHFLLPRHLRALSTGGGLPIEIESVLFINSLAYAYLVLRTRNYKSSRHRKGYLILK